MEKKMKPITEWNVSTQLWTLRDMMASEVIKRGPQSPTFAHALFDLITGRVDDPDVSDEDVKNLSFDQLSVISDRIAQKMIDSLRSEIAMSGRASIDTSFNKDSKPS